MSERVSIGQAVDALVAGKKIKNSLAIEFVIAELSLDDSTTKVLMRRGGYLGKEWKQDPCLVFDISDLGFEWEILEETKEEKSHV